ncbi:uncharacterized protein LOC122859657 [Aphidius gifuensis]|uniref:uncharacterized protein LOC122859657 n=1 Tax=Aphidius gifuensis TaxID=684658 RepID=UPI001CDBDC0A|nr:uncharacterized protein LOC122859657 [Aphidius gifuensis]
MNQFSSVIFFLLIIKVSCIVGLYDEKWIKVLLQNNPENVRGCDITIGDNERTYIAYDKSIDLKIDDWIKFDGDQDNSCSFKVFINRKKDFVDDKVLNKKWTIREWYLPAECKNKEPYEMGCERKYRDYTVYIKPKEYPEKLHIIIIENAKSQFDQLEIPVANQNCEKHNPPDIV